MAPSYFDWRDSGIVPPVRNQGACGSCFAFATLGNIESRVAQAGGGIMNYSENHAKQCSWEGLNWAGASCDSGNNNYSMCNLFSKDATILESCDPYVAVDDNCDGSCTRYKRVTNWHVISGNAIPATADLQNALLTYGPLYTTVYAGDGLDMSWYSAFSAYNGSAVLYNPSPANGPNHAVVIVGWDDTASHAGGTGAWIVRNSWGSSWGGSFGGSEGGYFKIAYGSAQIGKWSSAVAKIDNYDSDAEIMSWDEAGWVTDFGANPGPTSWWVMGRFQPAEDRLLTDVGFYTTDVTTDVDVYVYDTYSGGTLGTLLTSVADTSFPAAGLHTVALPDTVELTAGDNIYVAVQTDNASYTYGLAVDMRGATAAGNCYFSTTGANGSWSDLSGYGVDNTVRIYTQPPLALSVDDDDNLVPNSFSLAQNYPNPFNPTTTIRFELPARSQVTLAVFDILGRRVATIANDDFSAGEHEVTWDGRNDDGEEASSGVYLYRLVAGQQTIARKMLLLK